MGIILYIHNIMKLIRTFYVYILTNRHNTVLYTGVTNDLGRRLSEHRSRVNAKSFTCQYNVTKLVWFETFTSIRAAIAREKQIKAGSRRKKIALVERENSGWRELLPVASAR
jgi:putative endonuclease